MSDPVASLVIGFKDWDLVRLDRGVRSAFASFADVPVEVIVSDYGSVDGDAVSAAAASAGARYTRTETDGTWSRSRALNAGFAAALGDQFFTTDADMIFSPGTLAAVSHRLSAHPSETIILQCRDLPPETDTDDPDWLRYQQVSTLRPRWGMGGLVATHRASFQRVRGYDERMHTYGREDMDFGQRLTRIGSPINWLDGPDLRMYHVWHPSSFVAAALGEEGVAAINTNRRIATEDATAVRNRTVPSAHLGWAGPIVSIVVDGAHLGSGLSALLAQSVTNIEVILVNPDASALTTVERLQDHRIRVVTTDRPWWHAITEAHGQYLLLHSPDSWSPATRLESLLDHTRAAHVMPADLTLVAQTSDVPASLQPVPGRSSAPSIRPWASTLMPTRTAQAVADLLGTAASDPHDLLFALQRNGIVIEPVDTSIRVELVGSGAQGELELDRATRDARQLLARLGGVQLPADWLIRSVPVEAAELTLNETQRHLAGDVHLIAWSMDRHKLQVLQQSIDDSVTSRATWIEGESGEHLLGAVRLAGVSAATAHRLIQRGAMGDGALRVEECVEAATTSTRARNLLWQQLDVDAGEHGAVPHVVISTTRRDHAETAFETVSSVGGGATIRRLVLHDDDAEQEYIITLAPMPEESPLKIVALTRATLATECSVELWLPNSGSELTLDELVDEESA